MRLAILADQPLCRNCERQGRITAATEVDHIKRLKRGGSYEHENLQPLCKSCHSRKTVAERDAKMSKFDDRGNPLHANHLWNRA